MARRLPLWNDPEPSLVIGLVNNMPPAGYRAAEQQFGQLLQEAAAGLLPRPRIQLRCFAASPDSVGQGESLDALWRARLDGLIVTGAPPQADAMGLEPAFPVMRRVADWAAANTSSAIWSCFAAHAAVFHLDGLSRRRLPAKLTGVFRCAREAAAGVMTGAPAHWPVPHSRHFDLDPASLERAGYRILSRGPVTHGGQLGADAFEKRAGRSWFLMLQGHPEYAADTLLREYRRDLRHYASAGSGSPPPVPVAYFDEQTAHRLAAIGSPADARAVLDTAIWQAPVAHWHSPGVQLFSRWLSQLALSQASADEGWRRIAS